MATGQRFGWDRSIARWSAAGAAATVLACLPTAALGQVQPTPYGVSDAQLQKRVTTALHMDGKLNGTGNSVISVKANQGSVTLSGSVASEEARDEVEQAAAGVTGVRAIQDNVQVEAGAQQAQGAAPPPPDEELPPPPPDGQGTSSSLPAPSNAGERTEQGPPPQPQYTPYPGTAGSVNRQNREPYNPQAQVDYGPRGNSHPPRPVNGFAVSAQQQDASGPVTIPEGTLLSVRTTQALSTRDLSGGELFQATAAADIYAGGVVAIPRGAVLNGEVVAAKNARALAGSATLELQLVSMQLGGATYTVESEPFQARGGSKAGYTAENTIGGAAIGSIIGAVTGGGVGAGIGALAGGGAGVLVSGATNNHGLVLPAESLLQFHLAAPLTVRPLQLAEAERLAASAPQALGYGSATYPALRPRPVYVAVPAQPYPYGYYRPYGYGYSRPYAYGSYRPYGNPY